MSPAGSQTASADAKVQALEHEVAFLRSQLIEQRLAAVEIHQKAQNGHLARIEEKLWAAQRVLIVLLITGLGSLIVLILQLVLFGKKAA